MYVTNGPNVDHVQFFTCLLDHNEESRLQPAFEMTLDQNFSSESAHNNKSRKSEDSSSSTTRFKNLFGSTKTDGQKANLISKYIKTRNYIFRA